MEAEADLEVGARVAAVGMEVDGVRDHRGARAQEPARVLVEEVGLAADFVYRPAGVRRGAVRPGPRLLALDDARAPDHVMHDEASADRVPPPVFAVPPLRDVVHLADLDRLHVAVLGEAGGDVLDVAPPVGGVVLDEHLRQPNDQVRLARGPQNVVIELKRRRQIGRVALGGARPPPGVERLDLPLVERHVVLEVLDPDVLLDVPRGHGPGPVPDLRPARDHARERLHVLVGDQLHGGDAVFPVAADAGSLENRRDVAAERDVGGLIPGCTGCRVTGRRDRCPGLRREAGRGKQEEGEEDGRSSGERRGPCRVRHRHGSLRGGSLAKVTRRAKVGSNVARPPHPALAPSAR